jgi:hypothetical protein
MGLSSAITKGRQHLDTEGSAQAEGIAVASNSTSHCQWSRQAMAVGLAVMRADKAVRIIPSGKLHHADTLTLGGEQLDAAAGCSDAASILVEVEDDC